LEEVTLRTKVRVVASLLVVGVVLSLAAVASAVTSHPATHVTIEDLDLTFGGQVSSATPPTCVAGRSVSLWNQQGLRLGQTVANEAGRWRIIASGYAGISSGHFYATVKPTQFCQGAWSAIVPFNQGYPGSESQ
jgi:hypothetical protein